jgi:enoyl-CoA hydratase/carnithine racemase
MAHLLEEIARFAASPALRALVITGCDPVFSSGANIKGFQRSIDERRDELAPEPTIWEDLDAGWYEEAAGKAIGPDLVRALYNLQKPSIAAVNGPAFGFGCGVALSCDIRIASERAAFSEAFVRYGLPSADGSCWQLPRLIGMGNTLYMQYTAEPVDAAEAHRLGLVSKVVAHDRLMETTMALAQRLGSGATQAYALTKMLVLKSFGQSFPESLADGARAQTLTRRTEDYREGVRAFIEKREPQFKGR